MKMKPLTIFTLFALLLNTLVTAAFAAEVTCPPGNQVSFTPTTTKYIGIFSGELSSGVPLKSGSYALPHQFQQDGFSLVFLRGSISPTYSACFYKLKDNKTGVIAPKWVVINTNSSLLF